MLMTKLLGARSCPGNGHQHLPCPKGPKWCAGVRPGRRRSALTLLQPAKAGLATAPWRGRPREPAEATLKYRAGSSAAARQAQSDVEHDDDCKTDQQAKHGGPCPAQWVCGHGADTRLFGRRWEGS